MKNGLTIRIGLGSEAKHSGRTVKRMIPGLDCIGSGFDHHATMGSGNKRPCHGSSASCSTRRILCKSIHP